MRVCASGEERQREAFGDRKDPTPLGTLLSSLSKSDVPFLKQAPETTAIDFCTQFSQHFKAVMLHFHIADSELVKSHDFVPARIPRHRKHPTSSSIFKNFTAVWINMTWRDMALS
jgi:hypothetical protein